MTHPDANKKQNSIISETTSVDLTDGNKMSSSLKRKSIIKLPYKNKGDNSNTTTAEKKDNSETPNPTATAAPETSKKDGNHDKIQAEQSKKTTNKKPAKVFKAQFTVQHWFFSTKFVSFTDQNFYKTLKLCRQILI